MKRRSTSLVIREMQKPWDITSYLLQWPSSKREEIQVLVRMWRKANSCSLPCWCSHYGKQCGGPQKIKNRTTLWPNNSTSGHLSKGNKSTKSKRYPHSYVHCSILFNSQDMEKPVSIHRWMNKENVMCVYTHTYIHTNTYIYTCSQWTITQL